MKCFQYKCLGPDHPDYACLEHDPKGWAMMSFKLANGTSVLKEVREPLEFRIHKDDDCGDVITAVVMNTLGFLIVHQDIIAVTKRLLKEPSAIEFIPVRIINRKGRVASDQHMMISPIGSHDCMDRERSTYSTGERTGEIIAYKKIALTRKKVPCLPLFRIPEEREDIYFTKEWLDEIMKTGLEDINIGYDEVSVA